MSSIDIIERKKRLISVHIDVSVIVKYDKIIKKERMKERESERERKGKVVTVRKECKFRKIY